MVNESNVSMLIEPVANIMGAVMRNIQLLVGGVFGILVIQLLLRIYEIFYFKKRFDQIEKLVKKRR